MAESTAPPLSWEIGPSKHSALGHIFWPLPLANVVNALTSYHLDRALYIQYLDTLRQQIRQDIAQPPELLRDRHARAKDILFGLSAHARAIPEIASVLQNLTNAVNAFYDAKTHRGWAQQFVLQDLARLESLWPTESAPKFPFRPSDQPGSDQLRS